jgi:hypothetical protein
MRHGLPIGGGNDPAAPDQTETLMFAKTILALVPAGVSLSFVANASAAPKRGTAVEQYQTDYRGNPADTNGY